MQLPVKRELDSRLIEAVFCSVLAGGIAGICPGPAAAILLTGHWQIIVFVLAMLAGILLFSMIENRRTDR
jgi:hypothetical protein